MSEDALIRLENLRKLNQTAKELESVVGGRYTYWRDMLQGTKSFGEKIARKIEEKYGMQRGQLDTVDGVSHGTVLQQPNESPLPKATPTHAHLAQTLADLSGYLERLDIDDREDAMAMITVLAKKPERHSKVASAIEGMAADAFAKGRKKAA